MRIAVAQIDTKAGDLARTKARMVAQSHAAAERGADLLVFPLTTFGGPSPVPLGLQVPFLSEVTSALEALAAEVSCACVVPVVIDEDGLPASEFVLLLDGKVVPLLSSGQGSLPFAPGSGEPTLALPMVRRAGNRIALARTYDDLDRIAEQGPHYPCDVILFVCGYGYAIDDVSSALGGSLADNRFVRDARDSGKWIVAASPVGGFGQQVFCGSSFALAPDGRLAACAESFEEELLVADVGRDVAIPMGEEVPLQVYDERSYLWQALVLGLRDYVEKLGVSDVVLPLDGTLSSQVLAALATDALGPMRVHGLDCVPRGHARARVPVLLARTLRIDVRDMSGSLVALAGEDELFRGDLAAAELELLAREVGGIVLSPCDKTALALERGPFCGRAAWFAPLGDVYRVDVLDLARLRNTMSAVFDTVALVGGDVSDVGTPAASYGDEALMERIDEALALHVEGGRQERSVAETLGDEELARSVIARFRDVRIRREVLPESLALSTCTLAEYRLPHGFSWRQVQDAETVRSGLPFGLDAWEGNPQGMYDDKFMLHPSVEQELGERARDITDALELLRDLSVGIGTDWHNPFSEN